MGRTTYELLEDDTEAKVLLLPILGLEDREFEL